MERAEKKIIPKFAIIGIDFWLVISNNLYAFESSIHDRIQNLHAVNQFNLLSIKAENLNTQQLLMLKLPNNALRDAGLNEGKKIAVIIASKNSISSQISEHCNFTCPSFTLSAEENSASLELTHYLSTTYSKLFFIPLRSTNRLDLIVSPIVTTLPKPSVNSLIFLG